MPSSTICETDLYAPVKRMLESQGYEVKGEIGAVDIMACRGDDEPLIVELKTGFSLSLFHQAITRQSVTDTVYIAVPKASGQRFRKSLKLNTSLCRRLGLGLMTVMLANGSVEIHADPTPYKPRKSKPRKDALLKEFAKRSGDPNLGGATRRRLVTAYRQDALRCVQVLHEKGALKAALVAEASGVTHARRIMADNHYGWFERVQTGIYALTKDGLHAIDEHADVVQALLRETKRR
jgi:hypothetical protein